MFMFCRIPGKTYMIIAFLTVGTMGLSNTSLGYLNYPTQVIFKCCKLIPVMVGGVFIQGKSWSCCFIIYLSLRVQLCLESCTLLNPTDWRGTGTISLTGGKM